jgi:ankyrin repeat protein
LLIEICCLGNVKVIELMLAEGVSPSMKASIAEKAEPIHFAALEGNTPAIDLLVSHGININATDGYISTINGS